MLNFPIRGELKGNENCLCKSCLHKHSNKCVDSCPECLQKRIDIRKHCGEEWIPKITGFVYCEDYLKTNELIRCQVD